MERDASASFLGRPEERPPPGSVEVPADSEVRSAIEAFLRAARDGDLESLVAVLDPDVVWRSDGGGQLPAPRRPIRGAAEVAGMVLRQAPPYVRHARIVTVNGTPGVAVAAGDEVLGIIGFAVTEGRITEVVAIYNPDKLRHVRLA